MGFTSSSLILIISEEGLPSKLRYSGQLQDIRMLLSGASQGALLLVLFQASHVVEHILTERAAGDLKNLFQKMPEFATTVELDSSGVPVMGTQQQQLVAQLGVGASILVKPGETVNHLLNEMSCS